MRKIEFFMELRDKLISLPKKEIESRLEYFNEIIDDRIEEGMTEEDAVAALGSLDDIAAQITEEYAAENKENQAEAKKPPVVKEKQKKRWSLKWWHIALIILGAPLWFSILLGIASVVLSVVIVLFSIILSIYATVVALGISAVACILVLFVLLPLSKVGIGFLCLGAGLILAGVTVLLCIIANNLTKFIFFIVKKFFKWIKSLFGRKEIVK